VHVSKGESKNKGQIVLIDTPGVHKPDSSLGRKMMTEVREALEGCDLILFLVDATEKFEARDRFALELAKNSGTPVFLLLNKIDRIRDKQELLAIIDQYRQRYDFREIIPISALKRDGLQVLIERVLRSLPAGPKYFPEDQITDQPARFMAAEIVREQILIATREELPYATTVVIDQFEEKPKLTRIAGTVYCEREGQKAILLGKQGLMLKKIGTGARLQIEKMLGKRVFLELFVKVHPGWRESRQFVEGLDWRRQLENLTARMDS
jgi:GTP-binding protein Era